MARSLAPSGRRPRRPQRLDEALGGRRERDITRVDEREMPPDLPAGKPHDGKRACGQLDLYGVCVDLSPDGGTVFVALRGKAPVTSNIKDLNNAVGDIGGFAVLSVKDGGRSAEVRAFVSLTQ